MTSAIMTPFLTSWPLTYILSLWNQDSGHHHDILTSWLDPVWTLAPGPGSGPSLSCLRRQARGQHRARAWHLQKYLSEKNEKNYNKTKYFRLRLYYEVSKRAYRDLRLTLDSPETDPRQIYERKMRIQCFRQVCAGQTDGQTDSLSSWRSQK